MDHINEAVTIKQINYVLDKIVESEDHKLSFILLHVKNPIKEILLNLDIRGSPQLIEKWRTDATYRIMTTDHETIDVKRTLTAIDSLYENMIERIASQALACNDPDLMIKNHNGVELRYSSKFSEHFLVIGAKGSCGQDLIVVPDSFTGTNEYDSNNPHIVSVGHGTETYSFNDLVTGNQMRK